MAEKKIELDIVKEQQSKDFFHKNEREIVDTYVIRDGKMHPLAIICPGGGYNMVCSFVEGVPFARELNKKGISCLIVYYRVKGKAKYPNPQEDLAWAVRTAFERAEAYNLDMTNYSIWGSSAGGHLVASFGTDNMGYKGYKLPKPGALVLVYPVISMDRAITHMGTHDNLLGKKAGADAETFASVDLQVTSDYPRTYIWCGDSDRTVPPENTERMAAALEAAGVPYRKRVFPGVDHGVGTGKNTAAYGWIDDACDFWLAHDCTRGQVPCHTSVDEKTL